MNTKSAVYLTAGVVAWMELSGAFGSANECKTPSCWELKTAELPEMPHPLEDNSNDGGESSGTGFVWSGNNNNTTGTMTIAYSASGVFWGGERLGK